ncbi:MAG: metal-dependent hydrolase, partial [Mesorhizobium sp.]
PMIDQTADKFVAGMEGSGVKVALPEIGKAITV